MEATVTSHKRFGAALREPPIHPATANGIQGLRLFNTGYAGNIQTTRVLYAVYATELQRKRRILLT